MKADIEVERECVARDLKWAWWAYSSCFWGWFACLVAAMLYLLVCMWFAPKSFSLRAYWTLCGAAVLFSVSRKLAFGWYLEASKRSDEFLARIKQPPA